MRDRSGRYIPTPVGRLSYQKHPHMHPSVHPHACGEIAGKSPESGSVTGTSPRLWGDWPQTAKPRHVYRYIPTPVGRLVPHSRTAADPSVHPHACGEIGGMRNLYLVPHRYIPTPVGRLAISDIKKYVSSVHPHACGEINLALVLHPDIYGTSPRLWGDFSHAVHVLRYIRYIPTPVGRLASLINPKTHKAVHPHACGEIRIINELHTTDSRRYIPTPVGRLPINSTSVRVLHPHACGEIAYNRYQFDLVHPHACGEITHNVPP